MKQETIHMYKQGVVIERLVSDENVKEILSELQKQGYTCWQVKETKN